VDVYRIPAYCLIMLFQLHLLHSSLKDMQ
jgi:hypothetical protein